MQGKDNHLAAFAESPSASTDILRWIVGARFALSGAQVAVILLVHFGFGLVLPIAWLMATPVISLISNLHLLRKFSGRGNLTASAAQASVLWAFLLDTIAFTIALKLTGGPLNPFALLYLVQITLSAVLLERWQTGLLGLFAALGYASLFLRYRPLPGLEMPPTDVHFEQMHLVGMWAGFVLAASLITLFSGKISSLLRGRERLLLQAQAEIARQERLAALVTLAAGAAHELSTPLATIAIIAKDLELSARDGSKDLFSNDCGLIRREVERCKGILQGMSAHGAEQNGEAPSTIRIRDLLAPVSAHTAGEAHVLEAFLRLPVRAVRQSLTNLVKNAQEADPTQRPRLSIDVSQGLVRFSVHDSGCPIDPEVLRRIGEPFFTTKAAGKGMGLGVFLVRTLAERLNGSLSFESNQNGTTATLTLPARWHE